MRLAFYTDSFHPELGGIQDSIATLARALGARGHRVLIVAPAAAPRDYRLAAIAPADPDLGPHVTIERLPSVALPGSTGQSRLALTTGRSSRRVAAFGPDLVHVHTFLSVGRFGARIARRLGLALVGTNHWAADGFGVYAPRRLEAALARGFMQTVNRFYRRCALVTAPSQATATAMAQAGFARPVTVVSNPIDIDDFTPVDETTRTGLREALALEGPTLVYAGRLAIEKKVDVVIEAFARLAATRRAAGQAAATLALAGHGSAGASLQARAERLGIAGQVRFLGSLPHPQLARWLQAGDLFVTASTSESQCMALLQAMACARASVVVDSRALPEVLGPDAGLVARPDDPADLARQLARLVDAPAAARRCGEAARARASKASVSAITDQWETLYDTLVRSGPTRGPSRGPAGDHDRHSGPQRGSLSRALP